MIEDEDDLDLVLPPEDWAAQLLRFWFEDHQESDWFGGGPEFDEVVAARFAVGAMSCAATWSMLF